MAWIAALIGMAGQMMAQNQAAKNAPGPAQTAAPAQGGGNTSAANVFTQNVPDTTQGPPKPVEVNQFSSPGIGAALASAPAAPGATTMYDPNAGPAKPMPGTAGGTTGMDWSKVLAQAPEALAMIAPLLSQQPQRKSTSVLGAQGGGAGGSVVPGFGLPTQGMRRPTIGELLQSLPRAKYG